MIWASDLASASDGNLLASGEDIARRELHDPRRATEAATRALGRLAGVRAQGQVRKRLFLDALRGEIRHANGAPVARNLEFKRSPSPIHILAIDEDTREFVAVVHGVETLPDLPGISVSEVGKATEDQIVFGHKVPKGGLILRATADDGAWDRIRMAVIR